jgi:hypothetical protein
MQENCVVEEAIEPCRVCGSIEFNLSCEHCREILLTSGQSSSEPRIDGERTTR